VALALAGVYVVGVVQMQTLWDGRYALRPRGFHAVGATGGAWPHLSARKESSAAMVVDEADLGVAGRERT
jgi:hypothetical protein